MGNMYESIVSLCAKKGMSVSDLCAAADIRRSTMTELKMGRTKSLGAKNLTKVADCLGVSIEKILSEKEKTTAKTDSGHSPISENIASFVDALPADQQEIAWNMVRSVFGEKAAD